MTTDGKGKEEVDATVAAGGAEKGEESQGKPFVVKINPCTVQTCYIYFSPYGKERVNSTAVGVTVAIFSVIHFMCYLCMQP